MKDDLTPKFHDKSLCKQCRHSICIEGPRFDDNITFCTWVHKQITFSVNECSNFQAADTPALSELRQIAWDIQVDKKRNKIGFRSPEQRRIDNKSRFAFPFDDDDD